MAEAHKEQQEEEEHLEVVVAPGLDVAEAIADNLETIANLRAEVQDVLSEEHDDIFLLRYVLSYKTVKKAAPHVRDGIKFREENPWLALAKDGIKWETDAKMEQYVCAGYHGAKADGGPIQYVRAGLTNPAAMSKAGTSEELAHYMTSQKEYAYLVCDKVTRETGKLTKLVAVIDMRHQGFTIPGQGIIDGTNLGSKIAQDLYPQLLEKVVILNSPWFMQQIWKIARMVLSARLTQKVGVCLGKVEPGKLSECPWASKHLIIDQVPTFAGGNCNCEGGCVGGVTNECSTKKTGPLPEKTKTVEDKKGEKEEKSGWFW